MTKPIHKWPRPRGQRFVGAGADAVVRVRVGVAPSQGLVEGGLRVLGDSAGCGEVGRRRVPSEGLVEGGHVIHRRRVLMMAHTVGICPARRSGDVRVRVVVRASACVRV